SRRRHTRLQGDWSSDVCSSDLYNVSPDGKLFAGDGGGPTSVAAPGNGQWVYLFTPRDGALQAEKLVDLSKHNYRLEPNVTFTPRSEERRVGKECRYRCVTYD